VAFVAVNDEGKGAVLFYLLTYAVTNIGAFGVLALLESRHRANDQIADFAGLGAERPLLAALMTLFLLSLAGFPPLGGFIAKWYIFTARSRPVRRARDYRRPVERRVGYFYLRIIVMMYMTPHAEDHGIPRVPRMAGAALLVSAAIVVYLGIMPARVLDWAAASISTIF
jgi:NADH-quinone oxidoreductase subunit N